MLRRLLIVLALLIPLAACDKVSLSLSRLFHCRNCIFILENGIFVFF